MGENKENISRQTSFEDYYKHITTTHLQGNVFEQYLDKSNSPYTPQNIQELFQDDIFKNAIRGTWDYQRGDAWPKERTTQTAMSEGVMQGLSTILMQIGLREQGVPVKQLVGKTDKDLEIITETINLLKPYFQEVLPPSDDRI